mmetsp:Transcript_5026/g.10454  ORF Transcript_5026/g.10454 Transcript_5026/m.10454 type:complete len:210 (+) Transcript_5026:3306-3935(+)
MMITNKSRVTQSHMPRQWHLACYQHLLHGECNTFKQRCLPAEAYCQAQILVLSMYLSSKLCRIWNPTVSMCMVSLPFHEDTCCHQSFYQVHLLRLLIVSFSMPPCGCSSQLLYLSSALCIHLNLMIMVSHPLMDFQLRPSVTFLSNMHLLTRAQLFFSYSLRCVREVAFSIVSGVNSDDNFSLARRDLATVSAALVWMMRTARLVLEQH